MKKDDIEKNLRIIKERLNRRGVERLLAEFEFEYKIKDKPGLYKGKAFNISSFGIGFYADTVLYENEPLLFKFLLADEVMVIPGKVIRVCGKEVSCEFDISDEERERFIRLFNLELKRDDSKIFISIRDIKRTID